MKVAYLTMEVPLGLTPRHIAEAFRELDDEAQAQVFIEIAAIAKKWERGPGTQWFAVGGHLRTCACSNDDARELVSDLFHGMAKKPTPEGV